MWTLSTPGNDDDIAPEKCIHGTYVITKESFQTSSVKWATYLHGEETWWAESARRRGLVGWECQSGSDTALLPCSFICISQVGTPIHDCLGFNARFLTRLGEQRTFLGVKSWKMGPACLYERYNGTYIERCDKIILSNCTMQFCFNPSVTFSGTPSQ